MSTGWIELNRNLAQNAIQKGIPISAAFELTGRCNFSCKMCYVCHSLNDKSAISEELTVKQWIEIGEQTRDAGLFFLTLTGGEVFIRKDFMEIYEPYSKMGFNITIYTNASLITPEKAKWLGRIPPSKVCVTVYGASPDTYQKVTGHWDGYEKTVRGINLLKDEGVNVGIRTTVVQDNYKEFYQLYKFAEGYKVPLGIVNYISPTRDGCGNDPLANRLLPEMMANYEKEVEENNLKLQNEITEDFEKLNLNVENQRKEAYTSTIKKKTANKTAFKCEAGKCGFWINWKGYVTPCGLLDLPSEKIVEQNFGVVWDKLRKGCSKVPECQECQECSIKDYCMSCPARLMTETGAFDRPAPYLCETAKYRSSLKTKFI
jgi:MoaA/NifB/PqqE/SkfB family radical SAM enzyme